VKSKLQHFGIGQARIGHIAFGHHAGAGKFREPRAGAAGNGFRSTDYRALPKVKLFMVHWLAAMTPRAPKQGVCDAG